MKRTILIIFMFFLLYVPITYGGSNKLSEAQWMPNQIMEGEWEITITHLNRKRKYDFAHQYPFGDHWYNMEVITTDYGLQLESVYIQGEDYFHLRIGDKLIVTLGMRYRESSWLIFKYIKI